MTYRVHTHVDILRFRLASTRVFRIVVDVLVPNLLIYNGITVPILSELQSDRSDKLELTSTGTGGLQELRDHLEDSKASFAYVRVQYANDKESKREKFILVIWIGSGCKVMRKAKVRLFLVSSRFWVIIGLIVFMVHFDFYLDANFGNVTPNGTLFRYPIDRVCTLE